MAHGFEEDKTKSAAIEQMIETAKNTAKQYTDTVATTKQNALTKGTVPASTNLNTVITPGHYWLNAYYTNMPHTGAADGVLEVLQPHPTIIIQRYTRYTGAQYAVLNIFERVKINTTWYPWKTVLTVS